MTKKIPELSFPASETRRLGLLMDEAAGQEKVAEWVKEDQSKLLLLCQHYGIQTNPFMFYELALALARKLYPEPKKRGRKSKWTALNQGALVVEIERLTIPNDPARGVNWACTKLAKREPWESFLETKEGDTTPDPAEALRQVYYDFKDNKWAAVMRDAFKMREHEDTVSEWDEQVTDFVRNPRPK